MNDFLSDRAQNLFQQGTGLLRSGEAAGALACFQEVQSLVGPVAKLYLHIGAALHELKRYDEAVGAYHKAVELEPQSGEAHNNLGNTLMALGCFAEAVESFASASRLLTISHIPLTAGASALQALGLVKEAENICRSVITGVPDFAEAHWNLSLNLLLQGNYLEGWREYEWRWRKPGFTSPLRHFNIPLWDGSDLSGKTILLHAEQGFGDAIQFVRYAPLVAQRGGRVLLECHPQLVSLFSTVEGVTAVFPFDTPLPPFNWQVPLHSLPLLFETTLESIPSNIPYFKAPLGYKEKWASLMNALPAVTRIGIAWAGKEFPDPLRSIMPADLIPLSELSNTLFFSLQVDKRSGLDSLPSKLQAIDLTAHIRDFSDTAALIENLDLVISVDTAVAHLAAAMAKPVFLMVPTAPDWRWMLTRSDSPWYPSVKIFRQQQLGNWEQVVEAVVAAIADNNTRKKPLENQEAV
ncbi:MAG: tetratricopeptide repeat protein [Desulfuromonadales bacterium]